jgi:hypothetical protein
MAEGRTVVREVQLHCPDHPGTVYRPEAACVLSPPRSVYGWDVMVHTGLQRFLEHRQIGEIHDRLKRNGVKVPERTIQHLCQRFLLYVVSVHLESYPKLARLIEENGGYVLHIDATTTKGNPELLLMKDGRSGIRLLATSIPTESKENVRPHLETVLESFGRPVTAVRDMGKGIEAALVEVFPDVYIITCHYHFLRAVGLRLLDKVYPRFQRRVERTGIMKRLRALRKRFRKRKRSEERDEALELLEHILAYRKDGNGIAYPFSLPMMDLYRRCEEARPVVRRSILDRAKLNVSSPCLSLLENALNLLQPPPAVRGRIHSEYLKLQERWKWFERIRTALRYRNGPVPLNTEGCLSNKELEKGREMLDRLQEEIDEFVKQGNSGRDRTLKRVLRGISGMIGERREELFAPNVIIEVNGKRELIRLPRTNNTVEQDFRSYRRHSRRIRGDSDVERSVQRDGVGLAIVKNLEDERYLRLVYGRLEHMPQRFAGVSPASLEVARSLFQAI